MSNKEFEHYDLVMQYVDEITSGSKLSNKETKQMCQRFLRDLDNPNYDFKPKDAEFVISVIETTFVHDAGERIDGTPLRNEPFILEPWQMFIIYNLLGFYLKDTIERRYKEAFIFLPRKNGKTRFVAALSWALSLLERRSGSKIYIVGASLRQAKQSFGFINFNLKQMGEADNFRILDNNQESSISGDLGDGSLHIEALAANPDKQDSLLCNIAIADEIHAYRKPTQYNVIKEAMKAYTNKLMIGITTAGDNQNSFCYHRLVYCQKILEQTVEDEKYFVFIAKADEDDKGNIDYTDPKEHEKANPNYGVTIRPDDILADSMQAQNDPQQRKDFLAKSLNKYTSSMDAYFDIDEFKHSNKTVEEKLRLFGLSREEKLKRLAKLPIKWYGGADLAKLHDLTATALYGEYKGIDIVISHAFFPIVKAQAKSEDDGIPLFGWQDDGWLTMTNSAVTNHQDVVKWFIDMRSAGFKIAQVGFDVKFAREFFLEMKTNKFRIEPTIQYANTKSEGFRRIEAKAKSDNFYYMSSEAYEYCVQNVKAVEQADDAIKYEKVMEHSRIDIFDASVFASMQMLKNLSKKNIASDYINS